MKGKRFIRESSRFLILGEGRTGHRQRQQTEEAGVTPGIEAAFLDFC